MKLTRKNRSIRGKTVGSLTILYKVVRCFVKLLIRYINRDSSVGLATRYGLDVRGSNSGGDRGFLHLFRSVLGSTQPRVQLVSTLFPRG